VSQHPNLDSSAFAKGGIPFSITVVVENDTPRNIETRAGPARLHLSF
jgi:hypothetical protein